MDIRLDPVATTARLAAAMRAVETARPDHLFDDPFADTLAGDAGHALAARTGMQGSQTIAVRTRYADDRVAAAADAGVRQLVLPAAGMDTRAYRLGLPADMVVFELDRPELLRLKDSLLAEATPRCTRHALPADLTTSWTPVLTAVAEFDRDRPACWLLEGFTQYLAETDLLRVLDRITALAAPGSHLIIDFAGRSMLEHPALAPMLTRFAEQGMPWQYGTDQPEEVLAARGWIAEVSTMSAVSTAMGRAEYPDFPRGTPGVPHGYFVHATR